MSTVSVRDVALRAGVSVGTVSNVMNHPDKVAQVVGRAQAAAREHLLQQGVAGPGGELRAAMDSAERQEARGRARAGGGAAPQGL